MNNGITSTTWLIIAHFLLASLVSLYVAWLANRHREQPIWRYLALLMLANSVWTLGNSMELISDQVQGQTFWAVLAFSGRMASSPLVFSFAIHFIHKERMLNQGRKILLWLPSIAGILLAISNPLHRLVWRDLTLAPIHLTNFNQLGPVFNILLVYSYALLMASIIIFSLAAWRSFNVYKKQALVLVFSVVAPLVFNIIFYTPFSPVPGMDLSSIGFLITGILLIFGIRSFNLVSIQPVYRDILIENMIESVLVINPEGYIIDLNPKAMELYQGNRNIIGEKLEDALPSIARALKNFDLKQSCRTEMVLSKNPPVYFDLSCSPIKDSYGNNCCCLVMWHDITELIESQNKLMEQELETAQFKERELLSDKLHDELGQILNLIQVNLNIMRKNIRANNSRAVLITLDHLQTIVNDASLNIRGHMIEQQVISTEDEGFTQALKQFLERYQKTTQLKIKLTLPDRDLQKMVSEKAQMHLFRILQESLSNAFIHSQADEVEVLFAANRDTLKMVLSDNGIGFEPQNPDSAQASGLQTMQQRADNMNATLKINSAVGKGTQVICIVPRVDISQDSKSLASYNVMLVDDQKLFVDGIKNLLESHGAKVTAVAVNSDEALTMLPQVNPDMVILDGGMPGMNTVDFVTSIKSFKKDIFVVLLSMAVNIDSLAALLECGINGYLLKTQPIDTVLDSLSNLADGGMALAPEVRALMPDNKDDTPAPDQGHIRSRVTCSHHSPL